MQPKQVIKCKRKDPLFPISIAKLTFMGTEDHKVQKSIVVVRNFFCFVVILIGAVCDKYRYFGFRKPKFQFRVCGTDFSISII